MTGQEFIMEGDLTDIEPLYSDDGDLIGEKEVIIKSNIKTKWYLRDLNELRSVEQIVNEKGNIRTQYCKVCTSTLGDRVIKMPYKQVRSLMSSNNYIKGYGVG